MISALLVAAVMLAEPDGVETPAAVEHVATPAPTPAPEPVAEAEGEDSATLPTSFAMYVSLLEPVLIAGPTVSIAPISGALRLGAIFDGKHAVLLGIALNASAFSTISSTTLSFSPTYRYHFGGLRPGGFSPYLQGELYLGVVTSNLIGQSTAFSFGAGVGGGGEYLVMRHFGLIVGAGLRVIHSESSFAGTSTGGNQAAMYVSVGVALHF